MNEDVLQFMVESVLGTLDTIGVRTYHDAEFDHPVQTATGPTVAKLGIGLVSPSKDLKKALGAHGAIEMNMARALDYGFGESLELRIGVEGAYLMIEVPRRDPWLPTFQEAIGRINKNVFVGFKSDDGDVAVQFPLFGNEIAGLIVFGETGSGKTNLIRSMVMQALKKEWLLAVVDLKGGKSWGDLREYADLGFAADKDEATDLLTKMVGLCEARSKGADATKPVLVVFDEINKCSPDSKPQKLFAELANQCRELNMRLVGGGQRAGDSINKDVRNSLATRIVGRMSNYSESFNATGIKGAGADKLQGQGDMLVVYKGEIRARVQVPRADPPDIASELATLTKALEPPSEQKKKPLKPQLSEPPKSFVGQPAWQSGDIRGFLTLMNENYLEFEIKLKKEKGGNAKMPSVKIVRQSVLWSIRHAYAMPTYKTISNISKNATGKGMGKGRADLVRQVITLTLGIADS